jgi:hypothetical protein
MWLLCSVAGQDRARHISVTVVVMIAMFSIRGSDCFLHGTAFLAG